MVGWFGRGAPNRYRTRGKSNELELDFKGILRSSSDRFFIRDVFKKISFYRKTFYHTQY